MHKATQQLRFFMMDLSAYCVWYLLLTSTVAAMKNCSANEFQCTSGRCIQESWRCDGVLDCHDGLDESSLAGCAMRNCSADEFQCKSGECIPESWRCDRFPDCPYGFDESSLAGCAMKNCSANEFQCTSGRCIQESWMCDGVLDCPDRLDESSLAGCENIDPDSTNIRLVDGTGPYGGRVEVSINGTKGTICGDNFDMGNAKFLCRMMKLQATYFMRWAFFGQGTGPVYRMVCNHTENCEFNTRGICFHSSDISILCTKCPEIEVHGGEIVDVSADGSELKVKCYREFTSSTCIDGKWSPSPIICEAVIEEIRLTNEPGLYQGTAEVSINGTWGTVCLNTTEYISILSAGNVICKMLFGTRPKRVWIDEYVAVFVWSEEETRINPLIDRLDCSGSESNVNQCSYSSDVSSCYGQYRLYINCSAPERTSTEAGTQLVQHSHETKSVLQTTSESTTRSHDYGTTYSRSYISTKISDTSEPESTPTKSESLLGNDEVILIACVSAGILVVGILVVIVCCKRITRNVGAQNVNDGTTAVGELHNNTSPENIEMNEAGPGGVHVNLYESLSGRSERAADSMINDYSNLYVSLADRNETEYTNRNEYDTLHLYADCQ